MSRILLIDDESATRLITQNRLRDLGYEVVAAENGAKGLLEAREGSFDLILVDADLSSGVGGYEVCRRLKLMPQTAGVPLVMLSKHGTSRDDLHRGYEAGCEAFLSKSDAGVMEDVVRAMLRFKGLQDDLARQNRALEDQIRRLYEERQKDADEQTLKEGGDPALVARELAAARPDGVLLVDAEGIVRYADRGARDLVGSGVEGRNLGRIAPASGLEAFVRDARTEAREGYRLDLPPRSGRSSRSIVASVIPLVANPGEQDPGLKVVVVIDAGRRRAAAELMRLQEYTIPRREVGVLLDAARLAYGPSTLMGQSAAMTAVRAQVSDAARGQGPVLILGEKGSGREHAARAVHFAGESAGPFLPISCASLSPENLEAELFGQVKGAFPDALVDRPGLLQQAGTGTVYLAAAEKLAKDHQEKLVRLLREGQVVRAGAERPEPVEARLILSTTAELSGLVAQGTFLEELEGLLSQTRIPLPPLRERREDIPLLAQHFLEMFGSGRLELELSDQSLWAMESYEWPENVRELKSTIEHACAQASGSVIDLEHLPPPLPEIGRRIAQREVVPAPRAEKVTIGGTHTVEPSAPARPAPVPAQRKPWDIGPEEQVSLDLYEKKALLRALEETGGDKLAAARLLKVGKSTLYRKLKRYGIA